MRRRDFIKVIGGTAATWPALAWGQQGERIRRVGLITPLAADDPGGQLRKAALLQGLQELGWTDGGNIQVIDRWGATDADRIHQSAAELIALAPDVILAQSIDRLGRE